MICTVWGFCSGTRQGRGPQFKLLFSFTLFFSSAFALSFTLSCNQRLSWQIYWLQTTITGETDGWVCLGEAEVARSVSNENPTKGQPCHPVSAGLLLRETPEHTRGCGGNSCSGSSTLRPQDAQTPGWVRSAEHCVC